MPLVRIVAVADHSTDYLLSNRWMGLFIRYCSSCCACLGFVAVESKVVQTGSTFEGTPNSCMLLVPLRTLSVCPSVVVFSMRARGANSKP